MSRWAVLTPPPTNFSPFFHGTVFEVTSAFKFVGAFRFPQPGVSVRRFKPRVVSLFESAQFFFSKMYAISQNVWQQNRNVKQFSWSGPTDINCLPTKFIRLGVQAPKIFALCSLYCDVFKCKEINWRKLSSTLWRPTNYFGTNGNIHWHSYTIYFEGKMKAIPVQVYIRPWGSQEFEAPRFRDGRHMKMIMLSALRTVLLYPPENIPGTHFC